MSIESVQQRMDEVTIAIGNLMDAIEDHYDMPDANDIDPRDWPDALTAASDLDVAKLAYYHRIIIGIGGA